MRGRCAKPGHGFAAGLRGGHNHDIDQGRTAAGLGMELGSAGLQADPSDSGQLDGEPEWIDTEHQAQNIEFQPFRFRREKSERAK